MDDCQEIGNNEDESYEYFPFFEMDKDISVKEKGILPHWHQDAKIQYVTFRMADSLPKNKIEELKNTIRVFEEEHPKPWNKNAIIEYNKLIGPLEGRLLDQGYGSCLLKNPNIRKHVADAIMYYDKIKYHVIAYVIMPNHVHMILHLIEDNKLENIVHSIKRFSARQINKSLNTSGIFWMKEYFDRIVRSDSHFKHCLNYIRHNPHFLPSGEYDLYISKDLWRGGF